MGIRNGLFAIAKTVRAISVIAAVFVVYMALTEKGTLRLIPFIFFAVCVVAIGWVIAWIIDSFAE